MRGIILAGGTGSRLFPLASAFFNKHLLPCGKQPMIFWSIQKLVQAGIKDIMIVTGREGAGGMINCLGSGADFNAKFVYAIQDQAGGIAEALGLTRSFSYGERICVLLGDNLFEDDLADSVFAFNNQSRGARILLKEVEDPGRFGVVEFDENKKLIGIEEKPKEPKSNYAVTGIYFYDQKVFDIVDRLEPSGRGELEITDVNNTYLSWGELEYSFLNGWWLDAGNHESYSKANMLLYEKGL